MFGIEDDVVLKQVSSKDNVFFVDVREPEEIEQSSLQDKPFVAGKFLLEDNSDEALVSKELPDKEAHHIVFCAKGGRASKACQKLKTMGYSKVYNAGGLDDLDLFLDESED